MNLPAPIEIGCEAYIVRDGQLLLGLRKNTSAGSGTWALPGGRQNLLERADQAIIRELKEELDIVVSSSDLKLFAVTDDLQPERHAHHLHLTFLVDIHDQDPHLNEPDKCAKWRWFPLQQLPAPIFFAHQKIFATIKSGDIYSPEGHII